MTFTPATFTALENGWTVTAVSGPVPADLTIERVPAVVPGVVHTDLLRAALIADPFDGDNEAAQQWIGSTVWRYETEFEWADDGNTRHDLVAYGLDTVATIELNGQQVGRTENQHRSYRFDVRALLRAGANRLSITFAAPVDEVERRDAVFGERPHTNHHAFNQLRKSASNFGWDWGIDVATSGIWQPIGLDSWSGVRIAAVRPFVDVDGTDGVATVHVDIDRDGTDAAAEVPLRVAVGDGAVVGVVAADRCDAVLEVRVADVRLWWPVGHGEQPLYDVRVSAAAAVGAGGSAGAVGSAAATAAAAAEWTGRIGFRTVEVDTSPDAEGNRFVVRINGKTILIRGVNWIPDHAFVTEIDRDRYARRLADATDANVNLVRVWGGGIYESDDFYELADEAGILVWQDFLFACAAYAEEPYLADEVEAEAREQITRLAQHPSLVIWNGNNENIWGYVEWNWREPLAGRSWGNGYYRVLFPALLAELDPTRAYSPASPYSFVEYAHPNDPRNGTMHIWDVWNQRDYSAYRDYKPRFVSEFGFQGPPAWSTLAAVVHDEPLDPYGHEMLVHQKAESGNLKLERGAAGHLPATTTIEDWHWATQLNQAHAIRYGVEYFRSLTPHNTGTILWQLNDNWPVVSWAAVDFDEHRKPLWYAMRDAYAPRLATIQPSEDGQNGLTLVLINDSDDTVGGTARIARVDFGGTTVRSVGIAVEVGARATARIPVPAELTASFDGTGELIVATVDGFARALWNGAELKDQRLAADAVSATAEAAPGGYIVTVAASGYARDVFLHVDRVDPSARVDAGMVSLLAGENVRFAVESTLVVDPAEFAGKLVLRHGGDLLS